MDGVKKVYNDVLKLFCDDWFYCGLELNNNMRVFVISDFLIDKFVVVLDVYIGKKFKYK